LLLLALLLRGTTDGLDMPGGKNMQATFDDKAQKMLATTKGKRLFRMLCIANFGVRAF